MTGKQDNQNPNPPTIPPSSEKLHQERQREMGQDADLEDRRMNDEAATRARGETPERERKGDEATAGGTVNDDTQQTRGNKGERRNG